MKNCSPFVLLMLCLASISCAAAPGPPGWKSVDQEVRRLMRHHPLMLRGAAVYVAKTDGTPIYEHYYGRYDENTRLPLASASKLLSGVAVMTLVDTGRLDREAPISTYLPEFSAENAGHVKSRLTIDQLFSMTSGFPGATIRGTVLSDLDLTLAEAVRHIACCVKLKDLPGRKFRYGGYGMHVVGRIAEVESDKPYDQFFDDAVNEPLGTSITWNGLGKTNNFRPSGSGEATLRDYARVLEVVATKGKSHGIRLLSESAVNSMLVERTTGLPSQSIPSDAKKRGFGYGFGLWIEQRDQNGHATVVSSPGAFGFTPWIDFEDGYYAIIMVKGIRGPLVDDLYRVRDAIDQAVRAESGPAPSVSEPH